VLSLDEALNIFGLICDHNMVRSFVYMLDDNVVEECNNPACKPVDNVLEGNIHEFLSHEEHNRLDFAMYYNAVDICLLRRLTGQ
jgi:hypothetical protein